MKKMKNPNENRNVVNDIIKIDISLYIHDKSLKAMYDYSYTPEIIDRV